MVAMAEGNGGANPTHISAVANSIPAVAYESQIMPTLQLNTPMDTPTLWKVWWNAANETKDDVWLQELPDASMASDFLGNELTLNELSQGPGMKVGTETEFIVNGIPGAVGFQWPKRHSRRHTDHRGRHSHGARCGTRRGDDGKVQLRFARPISKEAGWSCWESGQSSGAS
jgi:hypothetical protein